MRVHSRLRRRRLAWPVAALLVLGIGGGAALAAPASATSPADLAKCTSAGVSSSEVLCALFIRLIKDANPGDIEPKDMKVAAPSSVITAVGSESPTRRIQEVNSWRPNPQSWVDAKARLAGTSGLTTKDISATARWAPKLLKGASVVGLLSGDSLLTWIARDGMLVPMLEKVAPDVDVDETMQNTYCQRYGNVVTDWVAGWTGADCAEWRLKDDFAQLVGSGTMGDFISFHGMGVASFKNALEAGTYTNHSNEVRSRTAYICIVGRLPTWEEEKTEYIRLKWNDNYNRTGTLRPLTIAVPSSTCPNAFNMTLEDVNGLTGRKVISATWERVKISGGTVVETKLAGDIVPDDAEWMTKVNCLDGTSRYAVSESFQQKKLGGVASPESVQLDGCKPVGVQVGVQKKGAAGNGAGGGWDSVPGGDRVGVQTAEVPQPVRDWLTNFPGCEAGTCLLELKKKIGETELDCFASPEHCANWQEDTATGTSTYNCYYSKTIVPLAECNVYGPTFKRDKVQQGTGYSDPKTGQETSTKTNPGAATTAMNDPARDASQPRQCWPTGWAAFNPFEWVFQPVKCVFEWAFVPRETVVKSNLARVKTAWAKTPPMVLTATVADLGNQLQALDGCSGPRLKWDFTLPAIGRIAVDAYPFSACDGVAATLAMFTRAIASILVILSTIFALTRIIGGIVNAPQLGTTASA